MRDRQLCAVTLAAASVPALLYLPRLGWVWATAAAAISALLLGLCGRRCAPGGLTEVIPAAFGRAGRAVHALVLLGGALLLGGAARALCAIYPESRGGPLTGLLLLLAAAYAAERGEETVLRSGPSCSSSSRRSRSSYWAFRPCRCARRGSRRRRDACPLPP